MQQEQCMIFVSLIVFHTCGSIFGLSGTNLNVSIFGHAAENNSVQLSLVNRYTQYPYIHIKNINNKPSNSFLSTNIHSLDYNIIIFNSLLINDYSESNGLESFNSIVIELKYLVTNLEEEIVKRNTYHLQAV
ncbi:14594_t:CDS:2 [Gigaspora margarita]|uniref:14594_t:CDS:1 n=1 Tax=Gigaspora margarita TaxID=4874 RepID=A0ABN7UPH8_GIGMA|nr:14594_t:CDS:2 [Gigaspora margarita]